VMILDQKTPIKGHAQPVPARSRTR
jgi:hypothetical protein